MEEITAIRGSVIHEILLNALLEKTRLAIICTDEIKVFFVKGKTSNSEDGTTTFTLEGVAG